MATSHCSAPLSAPERGWGGEVSLVSAGMMVGGELDGVHLHSRRLTRRALLVVAGTAACSLLGACQTPTSPARLSDGRPGDLPTPEPRPTQVPTPAAKPASDVKPGETRVTDQVVAPSGPPKPGGKSVWAAEADPVDLDPHTVTTLASVQAWGDLVYQGLIMFNERLKLVPCLAESWINTSPTTWTFKLRQGVRFHDGSEFEADDVRFWFERVSVSARAATFKPWQSRIVDVHMRGRYEVELTLSEPHAPLLATLAGLRGTAMVPRGWAQRTGLAPKTTAVGSGPFKIAEYVPRSHIRYVKHPDYWEKGLPFLDEVTLQIEPNEGARIAALKSGQVKYVQVGSEQAQRLRNAPSLIVLSSPGATQLVTRLNASRPPLDDIRIRQAIGLAVDRPQAITRLLGGDGRLTGPVPTGLGDWAMAPESLPYRQDLARVKRLLSDAGHPNGFDATIKARSDQPMTVALAMLMADQLRAVGINLQVEPADGASVARAVEARDFDIVAGSVEFLPDPDFYFSQYASGGQGGGPGNASVSASPSAGGAVAVSPPPGSPPSAGPSASPSAGSPAVWANPRYDEIVQQARTVLDPGQRKLLYDEAAGILLTEVPAIWWCTENAAEVVHSSIKGYSQSFTGRRLGLKKVWLDA